MPISLGLGLPPRFGGAPLFEPDATLALNFLTGQYRVGAGGYASPDFASLSGLTVTRASTKYALNSAGLAVPFSSGVASIVDLGCLIEESRSTLANKSRRLDDAAQWTLSTMTTSTVVGVDGVNASATRITASGANATALGIANTSASSARRVAPFVRRVAGTGNIDLTLDGGSTWTTINGLTSSYQRLGVGQTVANPKVGIRIVASGDSVDVDFLGGETGAFDTSPIESASAVATRAADVVSIGGLSLTLPFSAVMSASLSETSDGTNRALALIGTSNDRYTIYRLGTGNAAFVAATAGGVNQTAALNTGTITTPATLNLAMATASGTYQAAYNGNAAATAQALTNPATPNAIQLGAFAGGGSDFLNGYLKKLVIYPRQFSAAELQAAST